MGSLEKLKQILESVQDTKTNNNLYKHLSQIFYFIALQNPNNPFENFEEISMQLRTAIQSGQILQIPEIQKKYVNKQALEKCQELFAKQFEEGEDGVMQEVPSEAVGSIPNIPAQFEVFKWAGVDFGEEENMRIQASLKRLSKDKGVKSIKLWGKIYGQTKDYWIAETNFESEGLPEENRPPDYEAHGSGINTNSYFATNDLFEEWQELPDITPEQLKISRQIKKIFTGDLHAAVITNPKFPGEEQHLLRCQIARISHNTQIQPKGLQKLNEENDQEVEVPEDEFIWPEAQDLAKLENWVHTNPNVLYCGRTVQPEIEPQGEEDPEELKKVQEAKDPTLSRLLPVTVDTSKFFKILDLQDGTKCWISRILGYQHRFQVPQKEGPPKMQSYAINVIKSLRWQGATTVHKAGQAHFIYVGYGLKNDAKLAYYPVKPPIIMKEPEDYIEKWEEPMGVLEEQHEE